MRKTSRQRWIEGTISDITGPLSYKIKLTDRTIIRRHIDSVKKRQAVDTETETAEFEGPTIESEIQHIEQSQLVAISPRCSQSTEQSELITDLQRSSRIKRPPQ